MVDAANLDPFALLGCSQGCAVSIACAVRHPQRVTVTSRAQAIVRARNADFGIRPLRG